MTAATEGRCGPAGGSRETAEKRTNLTILAEHDGFRKPFPQLGSCIGCGTKISLAGGATTCLTCAAWRRWYSSHRVASLGLREVTR